MYDSISTPVKEDFELIAAGMRPKKLPIPIEDSKMFPPLKPIRISPVYIASITFVGVKYAVRDEFCMEILCS